MAIKVAPRPQLSFWDYLYIPPILRGMMITMKQLLRKNVTVQFPEQLWKFPFRYRGYPELIMGANNIEKCVACKLCEVVCPPSAITIMIGEYEKVNERERVPAEFEIDMGRCIVCGMCEEACPVDAIRMSNTHIMSSASRDGIKFKKTLLLEDYASIETMRK